MTAVDISQFIRDNGTKEGQLIVTIKLDSIAELEKLFPGQRKSDPPEPAFEGKSLTQVEDPDKPLSQTEAAIFLGVTRQYFYTLRRRGELKSYKLGNRVVFFKRDLLALLQEC